MTLTPTFFTTMASRLAERRWPVGPPGPAAPPDAGIGLHLPRQGSASDPAIERAALEAATLFVNELATATQATDATVAVEYDGEVVGWIANGRADANVEVGLLGEWRRALDSA